VVGLEALFEVNKKEVDKEVHMPFDSWMDTTTVLQYVEVWKQLLCYIFRAKAEDEEKHPGYELTERQRICIDDVRTAIREFGEWKDEQGREEEERESDDEIDWMGQV
jgi:hypothetical protein